VKALGGRIRGGSGPGPIPKVVKCWSPSTRSPSHGWGARWAGRGLGQVRWMPGPCQWGPDETGPRESHPLSSGLAQAVPSAASAPRRAAPLRSAVSYLSQRAIRYAPRESHPLEVQGTLWRRVSKARCAIRMWRYARAFPRTISVKVAEETRRERVRESRRRGAETLKRRRLAVAAAE
jgi:hypothetical protein